jgi:uncharacterized protein YbdZ (MbtH family)
MMGTLGLHKACVDYRRKLGTWNDMGTRGLHEACVDYRRKLGTWTIMGTRGLHESYVDYRRKLGTWNVMGTRGLHEACVDHRRKLGTWNMMGTRDLHKACGDHRRKIFVCRVRYFIRGVNISLLRKRGALWGSRKCTPWKKVAHAAHVLARRLKCEVTSTRTQALVSMNLFFFFTFFPSVYFLLCFGI